MFSLPSFRTSLLINNSDGPSLSEELDHEVSRSLWFVFIALSSLILSIIAAANSWRELQYTLYGVQTNARFVRAIVIDKTSTPVFVNVKYRFQAEDGKFYNRIFEINENSWTEPANRMLAITYLPSHPRISVLTSQRTYFWSYLLLILLLMPVFWCIKVWHHAVKEKP